MATKKQQTQTSIRLDDDAIARLDALAESLSRPGLPLTRADAMRIAIMTGLDTIDAEAKRKPTKK